MGTGDWRAVNGVRRTPAPSGEAGSASARRGCFIVLEGIDGSGKTEQTGQLARWLRARGHEVLETGEPTDGPWGRRYRAWARGEFQAEPEEVLRFFIEDRRMHLSQQVLPALAARQVVICDRYVASTLAYQAAQGLSREQLQRHMAAERFPEPDLSLWLRLPVEQALARIAVTDRERFERAAFLQQVDMEYERLGLESVDASGTPEQVAHRLQDRVARLLLDERPDR